MQQIINEPRKSMRLANGLFDLTSWRRIITQAADNTPWPCQVICPFGFEVSRNAGYLRGRLSNFYIYLGIPGLSIPRSYHLGDVFAHNLVSALRSEFPDFYSDVRTILTPSGSICCSPAGHKTFYVKLRACADDLLWDYAQYLLAAVGGVNDHTIKAVVEFERDPLSRRYLFQLCLILSYIFPEARSILTMDNLSRLTHEIKALHDAELLRLPRTSSRPSPEQVALLEDVVLPHFAHLSTFLKDRSSKQDDIERISIEDFHGKNILELIISKSIAQERARFIYDSYNAFDTFALEP